MARSEDEIRMAIEAQKGFKRELLRDKNRNPRSMYAVNERIAQLLAELREVQLGDVNKTIREHPIKTAEVVAGAVERNPQVIPKAVELASDVRGNAREREAREGADKGQDEEEDINELRGETERLRLEEEREKLKNARKDRQKGGKIKKIWGGTKKVASGVKTNVGASGGNIFLVLALVIYFLDSFTGRIGITELSLRFKDLLSLAAWNVFGLLIILHILQVKREEGSLNPGETASYACALFLIFITAFSGVMDRMGFIHLLFIIFFWRFVIRDNEKNRTNANILLIALIFVDFYLYITLNMLHVPLTVIAVVMKIPYLLLYTVWYCMGRLESRFAKVLFWVIVVVLLLYNWSDLAVATRGISGTVPGIGQISPFEALKKAGLGIKDLFADIKKSAEAQLEYATGGYYVGTVEENEKEQLGVYLENVEAADTNFLENEQVIVWGDLKARTLDEPIYVYMSCESGDVKGTISPKVLSNPEYSGNHQKGYEVQKLEEVGFECRFNKGQLGTGTNTIKIKAEFNFKTLAFLKTYFMDIERIRALRRENVDPLAEYGIKDKTPTAVFTNGPVRLGMGTVDPPLGLYADNDAYSYVGVTVEKQWNGEIKSIKEITIQVPKVFELDPSGDFFCRGDFKKETETEDGYAVYNMTDVAIGKIKTPISQFRSWRCSMKVPKAPAVLGETPVTTFYYRAGAKYTYEIEQPINAYVKAVAGEKTMLSGCDITCTDSDGCICDADNCKIPKGNYVGKDYTCNNYLAGAASTGRTVEQDLGYIDSVEAYINAMISLNNLCMEGKTEDIKNAIDSSADLSDEEKEQLKTDGVLTEGCGGRSYRFFEITEKLIVDKAEMGVDVFNALRVKVLSEAQVKQANDEKTEFLGLLDRVIEHFRAINRVVITEKNEANIIKVGVEKTELESINFG